TVSGVNANLGELHIGPYTLHQGGGGSVTFSSAILSGNATVSLDGGGTMTINQISGAGYTLNKYQGNLRLGDGTTNNDFTLQSLNIASNSASLNSGWLNVSNLTIQQTAGGGAQMTFSPGLSKAAATSTLTMGNL